MQLFVVVGIMILLLHAWALVNPEAACSVVAELMRRWRLHLIQRHGNKAAKEVYRQLLKKAKTKEDRIIVDQVFNQYKQEIVERFGTKEANARFGEPTPLERYF